MGGGHGFTCCICYHVGFEISCWIPHLYSCMSLMMTNVALSLQWCVPHIQAGGGVMCGVGHRGWREYDGVKDMEVGDGG